jgi:hypothetical protein
MYFIGFFLGGTRGSISTCGSTSSTWDVSIGFFINVLDWVFLGGTRGSMWLCHLWFYQFHLRCEFWFFLINALDWVFPRWDTWFNLTVPLVVPPVPLEMWVNGVEHCSDVEWMVGNNGWGEGLDVYVQDVYEVEKEKMLVGKGLVLTTLDFDIIIQHPYKPLVVTIRKFQVAANTLAQVV